MGINKRVSLRKFVDDIRRWVEEGRLLHRQDLRRGAIALWEATGPAINPEVCDKRRCRLPWSIRKQLTIGSQQSHHFSES